MRANQRAARSGCSKNAGPDRTNRPAAAVVECVMAMQSRAPCRVLALLAMGAPRPALTDGRFSHSCMPLAARNGGIRRRRSGRLSRPGVSEPDDRRGRGFSPRHSGRRRRRYGFAALVRCRGTGGVFPRRRLLFCPRAGRRQRPRLGRQVGRNAARAGPSRKNPTPCAGRFDSAGSATYWVECHFIVARLQRSFTERKPKRQTGRKAGAQSHGVLGDEDRQAAEVCNPSSYGVAMSAHARPFAPLESRLGAAPSGGFSRPTARPIPASYPCRGIRFQSREF